MMNYAELGRRLYAARQSANMTTVDVSAQLGMSVHDILRIEAGDKIVEVLGLMALCNLYHISIGEILGETKHVHNFRVEAGDEISIRYCKKCGKSWKITRNAEIWSEKWREVGEEG